MTNDVIETALRSLEAGNWDDAHEIVQAQDSKDAAWIHAHLHRIEGDLGNAAYWYHRAGRAVETGDLDAERTTIVRTLR